MKSYMFYQNNTGGDWQNGMPKQVEIQADSAEEANTKLEGMGGYFDGVENDLDCECCGDRWIRCED